MTCERIPGGFICGRGVRRQRCACGQIATLACDWKVKARRSGTCDAPICADCTTSPAPEKDLCPTHAAAYQRWLDR